MDTNSVRKLKVALALATVAYAGLKVIKYHQKEEELKKGPWINLKRKHASVDSTSTSSPSSSEIEEEEPPCKSSALESKQEIDSDDPEDKNSSSIQYQDENIPIFEFFDFEKEFSEAKFKETFHVSKSTANRLYTQFQYSSEYENIFKLNNNATVPAKDYIWMFLWFVARKCSYLDLADEFQMHLSKAVYVVDTVLQFLNNFFKYLIRFPETNSELLNTAKDFKLISDIPNVIACLVSTPIKTKWSKKPYWFQAFCDSKGRFCDVCVDVSVNLHPVEVLEKSPINNKLKILSQTLTKKHYHTLAGQEYFLRKWMFTPIEKPMKKKDIRYNGQHSSGMSVAQNALENLFRRFPQLRSMQSFSENKVGKMITACCLLHNICLEEEDSFESLASLKPELLLAKKKKTANGSSFQPKPKPLDVDEESHKLGHMKRKSIITKMRTKRNYKE